MQRALHYDYEEMCMNPYVSPLGIEQSWATGGLLAQPAGGEDGRIKGEEGADV